MFQKRDWKTIQTTIERVWGDNLDDDLKDFFKKEYDKVQESYKVIMISIEKEGENNKNTEEHTEKLEEEITKLKEEVKKKI